MTFRAEHQSARMSKITNDGSLTRSGRGCFIAVPIWQQWTSKGRMHHILNEDCWKPVDNSGT